MISSFSAILIFIFDFSIRLGIKVVDKSLLECCTIKIGCILFEGSLGIKSLKRSKPPVDKPIDIILLLESLVFLLTILLLSLFKIFKIFVISLILIF